MELADAIEAWTETHGRGLSPETLTEISGIKFAVIDAGKGGIDCSALEAGGVQAVVDAAEYSDLSDAAISEFLSIVCAWAAPQDHLEEVSVEANDEADGVDVPLPADGSQHHGLVGSSATPAEVVPGGSAPVGEDGTLPSPASAASHAVVAGTLPSADAITGHDDVEVEIDHSSAGELTTQHGGGTFASASGLFASTMASTARDDAAADTEDVANTVAGPGDTGHATESGLATTFSSETKKPARETAAKTDWISIGFFVLAALAFAAMLYFAFA